MSLKKLKKRVKNAQRRNKRLLEATASGKSDREVVEGVAKVLGVKLPTRAEFDEMMEQGLTIDLTIDDE